MDPHTTYILLQIVWSIVSLDIFYLWYEVTGGKYCGMEVTSIDPWNYNLSVYNFVFELYEQNNTKLNI